MFHASRRGFLKSVAAAAIAEPLARHAARAEAPRSLHIACNQFCWINMYRRDGKDFNANLDAGLAQVKRSGMDGLEAMLSDVATAERMVPLLKKHGLAMRSFYSGATLHDAETREAQIERVVATARRSKEFVDVRITVVNPTPLSGQSKSDRQLATQARGMTELGRRLNELGVTLAYHFHAPAWQDNGREFHHVMNETDPKFVKLCLDTHWVYRGTGDNVEPVYEVTERYGSRVAELHLRQSRDGVWTETLCAGDIDYRRVAASLVSRDIRPLLVVEQAVEAGTPDTMDAVESHRRSRAYAEEVFGAFAA